MKLRLLAHGQAVLEDPLGEQARRETRAPEDLEALLLREGRAEKDGVAPFAKIASEAASRAEWLMT